MARCCDRILSAISSACVRRFGEDLRAGMIVVCHALQRVSFGGSSTDGLLSLHSFKKKDVNFPFAHMTLKLTLISSRDWLVG